MNEVLLRIALQIVTGCIIAALGIMLSTPFWFVFISCFVVGWFWEEIEAYVMRNIG